MMRTKDVVACWALGLTADKTTGVQIKCCFESGNDVDSCPHPTQFSVTQDPDAVYWIIAGRSDDGWECSIALLGQWVDRQ
jgi:hypothetical protein